MDNKTVFVVTLKGDGEIKNHTHQLPEDIKRVLALVDDAATVEVLTRRAAPSLRAGLQETLQQLESGGYIRDKSKPAGGVMPKIAKPKAAVPPPQAETADDLDFTSVLKVRTEAEMKAAYEAETARRKSEQAAATKAQLESAQAKAEAEARAHAEAEARAKQEAEAARLKAEQASAKARAEAEAARLKAEQEAKKAQTELAAARMEAERVRTELETAKVEAEALAKHEAETARLKKEAADAKSRAEAEIERIKAEREAALAEAKTAQVAEAARIRQEAEARARQEAEAIRRNAEEEIAKARAEVEAARQQAEQEAAKARAEAIAKAKLEAEREAAKVREEAEAKVRQELEAARLKVEQETARAKAEAEEKVRQELEAARLKAEQDAAKAKAEAEARARQEIEAARLKAEQEAAHARAEAEEKVRKEIEAARLKAEQNAAHAKAEAEEKARQELEAARKSAEQEALRARQEAEKSARKEAEAARLKAEQEIARVKAEAEEKVRQAAQAQTNAESALAARIKVEAGSRDAESPIAAPPAEAAPITIQFDAALLDNVVQPEKSAAPQAQPSAKQETSGALSPEADEPEIIINLDLTPAEPPEETARKEREAAQAAEAARIKAEQEAQQQAEAERIKAEQESAEARLKAAKEAAKAEVEARKMAEEQAKTWAAAEQRAKTQAAAEARAAEEAKAEQEAKPAARTSARVHRKPLPIGKIFAGLLALSLVLAAALPYVWPMQGYIAPLESKLSAQLHQPVHIARMKAALFPLPKLELQDVSAGNAQELKAASVVLNFGIGALFSANKPITTAELNDLTLSGNAFQDTLSWLQAAGSAPQFPVMRMTVNHARIADSTLPPISGNVETDGQGHFNKAALRSDDGKLDLDLQRQQERWQLALRMKESSLPWLPLVKFSELSVKGVADAASADLSEIDGNLHGGRMSGDARLNWQGGWRMQGRVKASQLELGQAFPAYGVEGAMDSEASIQFSGASLLQPASAYRLDGSFVVSKGVISKMDMVETAAKHQSSNGGRTHFDEMNGDILAENGSTHLRQLRIGSGAMSATGSVDVNGSGQLSGRLSVELKMRPGSAALTLSGTPDNPVLRP